MKLSSAIVGCALVLSQAAAFNVAPLQSRPVTALGMFGGAGAGAPKEDNAEEAEKMKQAAQAMGMSLEEYTVAMNARAKMAETMDTTMVTAGKAETIQVTRDVNNPPKTLEITITEEGKALGKEEVSKKLCAALKKSSEDARIGRTEAQRKMMGYIQEQLKK